MMWFNVLSFQWNSIKQNKVVFILLCLTAVVTIYIGQIHHELLQSLTYLGLMILCAVIIDYCNLKYTPANQTFYIKKPKQETLFFLVSCLFGFVFLFIRFSPVIDWQHLPGIIKLLTLPFLLFVFPIALAIYLLVLRYKPNELGIQWQGFHATLHIILLFLIINRLVAPHHLTIDAILQEGGGIMGALFIGFISAGLSEEFFKMIGQTRLGVLFQDFAWAWFVTAFLWALMHAPKWYFESGNLTEALLSAIRIIPIGLMWSYLTHRTKSILPAVLLHGTNVWGLQNF